MKLHLPERIATEAELEEALTAPSPGLAQCARRWRSPLLVLGAGGKMGPTLCALAQRALEEAGRSAQIIAVSRFTSTAARDWLQQRGVTTFACDLFNRREIEKIPAAADLIYLVGLKFGTSRDPAATWAANTLIPEAVAERLTPQSRLVALSTGNVYALAPVGRGGAVETDPLTPLGEYPNAAVARERIFQFCARRTGGKIAIARLSYATELRYGVLVDIAERVWSGQPIDLAMGYFNCIWQRDANDFALRLLDFASSPPDVFNLTSAQIYSVRKVAEYFSKAFRKPPRFRGREEPTALVSHAGKMKRILGEPPTLIDQMLRWTAEWLMNGGRRLGRPTHFDTRDGQY